MHTIDSTRQRELHVISTLGSLNLKLVLGESFPVTFPVKEKKHVRKLTFTVSLKNNKDC